VVLGFRCNLVRGRYFCSVIRRGSDQQADYVLVQHIQKFLRLRESDSVQQLEAKLNAPKCRNSVMVRANFDCDRPTLPANAKTDTCSFDLGCRQESNLMRGNTCPTPR